MKPIKGGQGRTSEQVEADAKAGYLMLTIGMVVFWGALFVAIIKSCS